jgi:hypothetical protein
MNWYELALVAPLAVLLPNGSYVYEVCTVPVESVSATVEPKASRR